MSYNYLLVVLSICITTSIQPADESKTTEITAETKVPMPHLMKRDEYLAFDDAMRSGAHPDELLTLVGECYKRATVHPDGHIIHIAPSHAARIRQIIAEHTASHSHSISLDDVQIPSQQTMDILQPIVISTNPTSWSKCCCCMCPETIRNKCCLLCGATFGFLTIGSAVAGVIVLPMCL